MQFTSPTNRQPTTCLKRPPHDQENRGPNNNANNVDQQKKNELDFLKTIKYMTFLWMKTQKMLEFQKII